MATVGTDTQMWITDDYREPLRRAGLDDFDAVMHPSTGTLLRALPDRENRRLELHGPQSGPRGAYLKTHRSRSTWARMRSGRDASPAKLEAENVARLERDGIPTMRLIAYGEKRHADGRAESFLITEELAGFTQLDHFVRRRFPAFGEPGHDERDPQLHQLIRDVATVAAKFHACGYNHRDLYCCHFFIREASPGKFEVRLIDLQRVERRRYFRHRWIVKDLAQLAYSAPRERISCRQQLAFMKRYLGVQKLRDADKKLIRQVLAKRDFMEQRLGMHP